MQASVRVLAPETCADRDVSRSDAPCAHTLRRIRTTSFPRALPDPIRSNHPRPDAGVAPTVLKVATAQGTRFGVFNVIPSGARPAVAAD